MGEYCGTIIAEWAQQKGPNKINHIDKAYLSNTANLHSTDSKLIHNIFSKIKQ